jgi:glycopeptide antibiotics resistance protein
MISNLVVFIPFGLLLSLNFKQSSFKSKLALIFAFSLAAETIQYVVAIGRTDITDVIINTLGGIIGLGIYDLSNKYIATEKLDRFIVIIGTVGLILFLLLRFLVFRVRY